MRACVKYGYEKVAKENQCKACVVQKNKMLTRLRTQVLELETELLNHKKANEIVIIKDLTKHAHNFVTESLF